MTDKEIFAKWLLSKNPKAKCPICTTDVFYISNSPKTKMAFSTSRVALPFIEGDGYDVSANRGDVAFELTCDNCGYIMLFDAQIILHV